MESETLEIPKSFVYLENLGEPMQIEYKDSPIHGQGIFVTEDIPAGGIILVETIVDALVTIDATVENPIDGAIEFLSDKERVAFYNLHYDLTGSEVNPLRAKFLEHALDIPSFARGGTFKGLFLAVSKLNHSPFANASLYWDDAKKQVIVEAERGLEKGEEVTIAYCCRRRRFGNSGMPSMSFRCNCEICSRINSPASACLCHTCRMGDASTIVKQIHEPDTNTKIELELEHKPYTQQSGILTWEMMKLNIETTLKEEKEASLGNSKSPEQKSPESKKAVEEGNDDFDDGFYLEDNSLESDGDEDDLGNLDVRPGLHSWLE